MSRKVKNEIKLLYRVCQSLLSITIVCLGRAVRAQSPSAGVSSASIASGAPFGLSMTKEICKTGDGLIKTSAAPLCSASLLIRFFGAFPVPAVPFQPVIFTELFKLKKEHAAEVETESKVSRTDSARSFKRVELFHKTGVDGQSVTINLARDSLESSGEACLA